MSANPRLAYIPSRFPLLTETFILREICEMRRRGWDLHILPLIVERPSIAHSEAGALSDLVVELSLTAPSTWLAAATAVARRPLRASKLAWEALWGNRSSPGFLLRAAVILPKAMAASRWVRRSDIAHLHVHYATHSALMAWIVHHMTGVPYSITMHAHDIFVDRSMLAAKLRDAAFLITVSHHNHRFIENVIGSWAAEKTHVVRCGIEVGRYRPAAPWQADRGPLEILSIGSLELYKGFEYLLQACLDLQHRGVAFRCRIVGGGPLGRALQQTIEENGLGEQVALLGPRTQDEIATILPTAHCYTQPSIRMPSGKREGLPVALMEALACELPVIASDLTGIPELVRPGETGILVPVADAAALADALESVASDYPAARALARRGRRLVEEEYDIRQTGLALGRLIRGRSPDLA